MELGTAVIMALALSLDGLTTGLAYGWRRILVPWFSLLGMGLVSTAVIGTSLALGGGAAGLLPAWLAPRLGGLILVGVGIWVLVQQRSHLGSQAGPERAATGLGISWLAEGAGEFKPWLQVRIGFLRIVIQVLRYPDRADMDASGAISWPESLLLGLALSLDAFGAGFAAGIAGLGGWPLLVLVPGFQMLMVSLGLAWGRRLGQARGVPWQQYLPGLMLILIGIIRFQT
ncbi:MAG: manganese efflux pump [Clostridia bacterium]|nr:manganese efflux pump [Clostridia bacterium]